MRINLRWPWRRRRHAGDRLVIGSDPDRLAWLHADASGQVRRCGVVERGSDEAADFARRVRGLGLPAHDVTAVLALRDVTLLQIETPAVKPEEMKSAARWRIKDLVETRLDELTIDVMHVGDERARQAQRQLFVAAARNALIQDLVRRTQAGGLGLSVIDIAETVQRNLQTAAAEAAGIGQRATAALGHHGEQALLTICAGGELCFARRLDWDDSVLAPRAAALPALPASFDNLDFVDYGAADGRAGGDDDNTPRLVVELQRSFDVWERSWPDLPVALLWVQAGDADAALIAQLEPALGFAVRRLDPVPLFPGFADAAHEPQVRAAVMPLLGALRREPAPA